MHLVVIGGSDAGIGAALRAREMDDRVEITVLLADAYPNFSICGLPFYLSGETPDWRSLAHRTVFDGIDIRRNHRVRAIDTAGHTVTVEMDAGTQTMRYDRLVVATGAEPAVPPIAGLDLPGVFVLHTMDDSFRVQAWLAEHAPRSAVIVGAGYIGMEMADALTHRGLDVIIASRPPSVLPTVDPQLGRVLEDELVRRGLGVVVGVDITTIRRDGGRRVVVGPGLQAPADLVIIATGVRPATALGVGAGLPTGVREAFRVNRRMETGVRDVYAAGDCVETWHRVLDANVYLPLGTTAHKQGRIAGENAVGGSREFAGVVGTQVVKVFELAAARTGLRDGEARAAGFDPVTIESVVSDHKAYYPGARELRIRVTGDRSSGRLLGAQIVGHWQADVAKRIDVFATALFHRMTVEELNDLDLSYTPPMGSPWDAVQVAAQAWQAAVAVARRVSRPAGVSPR